MAVYPNAPGTTTVPTSPPFAIYPGDSVTVFNAETPAVGSASIQVALAATDAGAGTSGGLSLEVSFGGAPGVFEVDVQESDTDADAFYQQVASGSLIAVSANNTGRIDMPTFNGRFARALLKSRANSVTITAKFSRPR